MITVKRRRYYRHRPATIKKGVGHIHNALFKVTNVRDDQNSCLVIQLNQQPTGLEGKSPGPLLPMPTRLLRVRKKQLSPADVSSGDKKICYTRSRKSGKVSARGQEGGHGGVGHYHHFSAHRITVSRSRLLQRSRSFGSISWQNPKIFLSWKQVCQTPICLLAEACTGMWLEVCGCEENRNVHDELKAIHLPLSRRAQVFLTGQNVLHSKSGMALKNIYGAAGL